MKKDSNNKLPSINKWMGSIVGLAIGDQLGSLVEGKSRGSFERIMDMQDDTFWTDDTSQALCIADSLSFCWDKLNSHVSLSLSAEVIIIEFAKVE